MEIASAFVLSPADLIVRQRALPSDFNVFARASGHVPICVSIIIDTTPSWYIIHSTIEQFANVSARASAKSGGEWIQAFQPALHGLSLSAFLYDGIKLTSPIRNTRAKRRTTKLKAVLLKQPQPTVDLVLYT